MDIKTKREKRFRRHNRVRAKAYGTAIKPRLSIFRSGKYIYCQIVNDEKGVTLVAANSRELKKTKGVKKTDSAFETGKLIAKKSLEKKINIVFFDRGGYKYHGRIKSLAEGAREGGLSF